MNIVIAVDLSSVTHKLLKAVRGMAGQLAAKVWIVHVASPDPDFIGYEVGPEHVRTHMAAAFREEHEEIQKHAKSFRDDGIDATAILVQGSTADMILKEASKRQADLIVIGSHGHGAAYHLLVGNVGEQIIRRSTCPVLVVPARVVE